MLKTYTYKSVSFHSKFKYTIIEIVKIKFDMKVWSIKIKKKKEPVSKHLVVLNISCLLFSGDPRCVESKHFAVVENRPVCIRQLHGTCMTLLLIYL